MTTDGWGSQKIKIMATGGAHDVQQSCGHSVRHIRLKVKLTFVPFKCAIISNKESIGEGNLTPSSVCGYFI